MVFDQDGFNFSDYLDVMNLLQRLPVISGLYRSMTGAETSGGTLYGGSLGSLGALTYIVIEEATGPVYPPPLVALMGLFSNDRMMPRQPVFLK